jgi:hypothetical protein
MPHLIVLAPDDGRACPAWIEGKAVYGHCGDISRVVPIYVVTNGWTAYELHAADGLANEVKARGYVNVTVKRKKATPKPIVRAGKIVGPVGGE